jgi:hypothetical protein
MGNVQQQFTSFVGPNSPLGLMNEDTFLVVLKNLQVSDYVHFTMLCRKFNEFFGSNNFLWAQVCELLSKRVVAAFEDPDFYEIQVTTVGNIADILLAAYPGERMLVNSHPLTHRDTLNVHDKQLVSQFNFKDAIKRYYIHFIQADILKAEVRKYSQGIMASSDVQVKSYDGQFKDVWVKADLKKKHPRDFYYYVNFAVNPQKLEKMKQGAAGLIDGVPIKEFKSELGGRLVVYQNSDVEPRRRPKIISRMPVRRPELDALKPTKGLKLVRK